MSKNLTTEELLKLAEQSFIESKKSIIPASEEVKLQLSDVKRFIIALNIQEGRCKAITKGIWEAYTLWSKKPVSKNGFFKEFSRYFIPQKFKTYRYYLLNLKGWELVVKATKIRNERENQ